MSSYQDRTSIVQLPQIGCPNRSRAKHALMTTGFIDHWSKMDRCRKGAYCNSSYCKTCRNKNSFSLYYRVNRRHNETHGDDTEARENLRFVTILFELAPIDYQTIKDAVTRAKRGLAGIRRSFPGLWLMGRIELEAIDVERVFKSRACERKMESIRELNGGHKHSYGKDMILVHLHAIMFLNGHDEDVVRDKLKKKWPTSRSIKIDRLHKDKPIKTSLKNMCFYLLKDRIRYNYKMDTDGYETSDLINTESLSFLVRTSMIMYSDLLIYSRKGKVRT